MRRVTGALGAMRAGTCEQQIGGVAIGESRDGTPVGGPAALPSGLVIGDLRTAAIEEAARLEEVRRLWPIQKDRPYDDRDGTDRRPCVAVLTRRGAARVNHWAYGLVFEDSELQPLWATVIGIRDEARLVRATNRAIRERIALLTANLEPAVAPLTRHLLLSLLPVLDRVRSLAVERETAIADALRQQRGRLATSLLQPGLFDRRAERAAAAHNATLDEALARCGRRLAELERTGSVSVERRLAFGLVCR
jgi:hypothetical protein